MGKMKVLGFGINPSTRVSGDNVKSWCTDSPPDPAVRDAFREIFGKGNYKLYDVIRLTLTNEQFKKLGKEKKRGLCEDNEPELLNRIREFKPNYILLLTSNADITKFMDDLKEKHPEVPERIKIKHPAFFCRRKSEEWKEKEFKTVFKKHLEERLKEEKIITASTHT
jgi:hypothetical protein